MNVDVPLDGINNVTIKKVGSALRFMILKGHLVKERAFKVSMRDVRNQGCIGIVRAIVVVFKVNGVRLDLAAIDIDASAIGMRVELSMEFSVEVVDPQFGVGSD